MSTVWRFVIRLDPACFGEVVRVSSGDLRVGDKCHRAIASCASPCERCPIAGSVVGTEEAAAVVRTEQPDTFRLVTAQGSANETAEVSETILGGAVLSSLLDARVSAVTDRARLSNREAQVLTALVNGRAPDEFARELGIARRTVKFHQSNLLQKLGVKDRVELLRLFL